MVCRAVVCKEEKESGGTIALGKAEVLDTADGWITLPQLPTPRFLLAAAIL